MSKKWVRVLMLLCFAFPAMARDLEQDDVLRLRTQGVIVSLEDLLQLALQRYPGARLLEAELEDEDGKYVYEVELLTGVGAVRELEFDARSGELLKDEEED